MAFKKLNLKFFLGAALAFIVFGQVFISFAQFGFDTPYEVSSEVGVVKNDFVKARKKAVKIALTLALEQGLRGIFGDDVFEQNTFIQKYRKQNYCLCKVCNCSIREPRVKIKELISTLECDHNPSLYR